MSQYNYSYSLPFVLINDTIAPMYEPDGNDDNFYKNMDEHFGDSATTAFRIYCSDELKNWLESQIASESEIEIQVMWGLYQMSHISGSPRDTWWVYAQATYRIKLSNYYFFPQLSSTPPSGSVTENIFALPWRVKFIGRNLTRVKSNIRRYPYATPFKDLP